ncbi:MAG TPA: hypothetical protein VNJ71_05880 [Gemmatimonadales bacterium]|nr:hypothetical protein [Gemmatimonadales bacterium]
MRRGGRAAALTALVVLGALNHLAAQRAATVSGRVVLVRRGDSVPVAGARVTLHRIARDRQGPLDSTWTGPGGEFRFRLRADTSAIYLMSAPRAGIEYFSAALPGDSVRPDSTLRIILWDTSTTQPVETDARHVVVSRPGRDGGRGVLEIVTLVNRGDRTRIARDSTDPTWAAPLPRGAASFRPGTGDFSPDVVIARHDSVLVFGPVAPGFKQAVYTYVLPRAVRRVTIPAADSVAAFDVLLEETGATARGGAIALRDTQTIEGRTFRQWAGSVGPRERVEISFAGGGPPGWLLPALVIGVALALGGAGLLLLRRRPAPPAPVETANALVLQIAALDARYRGREHDVSPEEWRRYQSERAVLKARLEAHLAARPPGS